MAPPILAGHLNHGLRSAWLCALLSVLAIDARAEVARCKVDIPAESLPVAIVAFTRQCKIQALLLSEGTELQGVRGNAVSGEFAPAEALRRLLANTGWTFST